MKKFENYKNEYIKNLKKLIEYKTFIESDKDFPTKNQLKCLKEFLSICKNLGFTKIQYDENGEYGYAEIGEGKEMIGILGHLDTVGPGDISKWDSDPFDLIEKDYCLYGRGTIDDKGPLLLQVYVIKSLLDEGIKLNKRIRIIVGNDEEVLWRGINKYIKNEELPSYGYTPDAAFPVTIAEKGLLQIKIIEDISDNTFHLEGGTSINAVPDKFTYKGFGINEIANLASKNNIKYKKDNNSITFLGKTSHAMHPTSGINAIISGAKIINNFIQNKTINFIKNELDEKKFQGDKLLNQYFYDEVTGNLTFNLGKIEKTKDQIIMYLDFRIPVTVDVEEIKEKLITKAMKYDLKFEEYDYLPPLYVEENNKFIQIMMNIYNDYQNTKSKPIVTGGATYARSMPNIVAFGPLFPNDDRTEHEINEKVCINTLEKSFDIYQETLLKFIK